jgi:hypothetical protein
VGIRIEMAEIELTSGVTCPVCKGNRIELPDTHTDETAVECSNCQATLGTWGEVREAAGPLLSMRAQQDIKEVLQAAVPEWQTK